MTQKIFICGWGNTGTRLIVDLLLKKNCKYPFPVNPMSDYRGVSFVDTFKKCYQKENYTDIYKMIDKDIKDYSAKIQDDDKVIFKHGHFLLNSEELSYRYDSKFIICIRDPYDMLMDKPGGIDPNYTNFGFGNSLLNKIKTLDLWYSNLSKLDDFIIVRLEDLLKKDENVIQNIYKYIGVDQNIDFDINTIIGEPSNRVGKGKEYVKNHQQYSDENNFFIQNFRKKFGYISEQEYNIKFENDKDITKELLQRIIHLEEKIKNIEENQDKILKKKIKKIFKNITNNL
jgi:hypothetical protein